MMNMGRHNIQFHNTCFMFEDYHSLTRWQTHEYLSVVVYIWHFYIFGRLSQVYGVAIV